MSPPTRRSRPAASGPAAIVDAGGQGDALTIGPGTVRAVYVIAPCRDDLDAADVFGLYRRGLTENVRIAIELGSACYAPSAASALADLVVSGHDVDIRGGYFAPRLADEVQLLLALRQGTS